MGFPLHTTSESELELYIAQDMFQPQQSALLRIICRPKTKGTESFVISVSEKDIYVPQRQYYPLKMCQLLL